MRPLLMSLVRLATLAVGLVVYARLLVPLWSDPSGGADIGAGLIAFALLATTGFGWGLVDGRRVGTGPAVTCWAVVALLLAVGWNVVRALTQSDASMSASELFVFDLVLVPFFVGLVLVPAAVGSAIGGSLRPAAR